MLELFDKDFFKFTIGFAVVVAFSLVVLGATGVLDSKKQHEANVAQQAEEGRD